MLSTSSGNHSASYSSQLSGSFSLNTPLAVIISVSSFNSK